MSVMSDVDLACQEVQDTLLVMAGDDVLPEAVAVEMTLQLTVHLMPVATYEFAVPYMIRWAYESIRMKPATRH